MNCTSEDQPFLRGEICVRGPNIFQGCFKDEVQKEVFDADGCLHTGDIGLWLPEGRLKIINRQAYHCDNRNSNLVAVVSVEPHVLKDWAMSAGIMCEDLGQLCKDPIARAAVLADVDVVAQEAELRKFDYAKAVTLLLKPSTLENGLLTPTFKNLMHLIQYKRNFEHREFPNPNLFSDDTLRNTDLCKMVTCNVHNNTFTVVITIIQWISFFLFIQKTIIGKFWCNRRGKSGFDYASKRCKLGRIYLSSAEYNFHQSLPSEASMLMHSSMKPFSAGNVHCRPGPKRPSGLAR
ncbi:hypothetical protein POM88_032833 [Heracleum sosnowskyi]|uniref:AMP-dependent synthetase/ligase domain-containing protein n=1 Tax=Heracleum sosnowskyi TaxID=360622 RepID=A0AAD8I0X5_9APIA|nr:hypothetical protein POM88_032833 [Heracleum sosnowskyi]